MSMMDEVFRAVRDVPLLHGLSDAQIRTLAQKVERRVFEPGETLLAIDTPCEATMIIVDGVAERVTGALEDPDANTVRAGSVLAEMAMVVDVEPTSTIVAKTRIKALQINQADLIAAIFEDQTLSECLIAEVTLRLRGAAEELQAIEAALDRGSQSIEAIASTAQLPPPVANQVQAMH